ncbi:MAG: two-component sensor histidine kinase [Tardiphaga sp.]|nr:two-component sensor histidine kinase [Tardiphaga sp.]
MMSLRGRLLLILIASTSVIWICGFAWIGISSQAEIQRLLDRRLMEAARMVASLDIKPGGIDSGALPAIANGATLANGNYERRLNCQIWSFDGHLVGRSDNAPTSRMTDQVSGFSERDVDGVHFRVYAIEDAARGVRVLVGDDLGQRYQLLRDLLGGLLVPALVILPLLAFLIWISVRRGLAPLQLATATLSARDAENLTPLEVGRSPSEIRPLIEALNKLFGKVVAAREHERSFVAYAAHEMRTPLAGLKTQAQVAAATPDPKVRATALRHVVDSVDRTARLVKQLLAMSQLDATTTKRPDQWINIGDVLADINRDISRELHPERIKLSASLRHSSIAIDRELFDLAARNLVENALQLSPAGGTVRLSVQHSDDESLICIEDDGPGIPADEQPMVLQRFFRGRHKSAAGSGLGLAIVTAALDQADATLRLCQPDNGRGLRAEIVVPASRIRRDEAA